MTASPSLARESARRPVVRAAPAVASPTSTGNPLSVVARVRPGQVEALEGLLLAAGNDLEDETILRVRDLRLVHFLRWVIVPPAAEGSPHLLVFGSDHDGTRQEHLEELWRVCGEGLKKIYAHCSGGPELESAEDLQEYFAQRELRAAAVYSGTRDRSAVQIRAEARLQAEVADWLDTPAGRKAARKDPLAAVRELAKKKHIADLDVDVPPRHEPTALSRLARGPAVYPLVGLAIAVLGVPALLFALAVRLRELTEPTDRRLHDEAEAGTLGALKSREDHRKLVQNQLTHVVAIKPGWFRMRSLGLVLWAIDFLARNYFDRGELGGIPSIHYARWMILEEDRRLLFFSNFDGSWESYLGDFVDQAAKGLTGVWSNTVGFPPALFLLWRGARDEESFKNWTRHNQIETQLWYSAYPTLSVQNVNDNTKLRAGLSSPPEGAAMQEWLRTL